MLRAGAVLGHYEIRDPLGEGGMGKVYRARDRRLEREVAVKVLPDHLLDSPQARARFEREAKAIAALSHPHILTIHDFGEEGNVSYAVMELLEGETIAERLRSSAGPMPLPEVLRIATAAARGLAAAHERGIIHRDIKPANLFLTADGQVKILDFGLARSTGHRLDDPTSAETKTGIATTPGTVLGTVGYMSPEQARGEEATAASDVFSLGCVLYELTTGSSPFGRHSAGETLAAILHEDPPPIAGSRAGGAPGLQRVLSRCLARDAEQRFPSARELTTELEQLEKERSGSLSRWLVAAALVPLLGGGLWLLASRGDSDVERARQEGLPRLLELVEEEQYYDAFVLARELEGVLPEDPVVAGVWDDISERSSFTTDPPGAEVSLQPPVADGEWVSLGTTPLVDVRFPFGVYRWRVEREGFETAELTFWSPLFPGPMALVEEGSLPPNMVRVPGWPTVLLDLSEMPPERGAVPDYLIGKYEVTNREFQAFVDAGGYEDRSLWKHPFLDGDETLSWKEAMERFRDSTGRPGPATWELGRYPEGQESYPVQGVSWYEAAAYAQFADAELPTVFHWTRAANTRLAEAIVPASNLEGEGPAPVGSFPALTWGVYDMAGNVREWCRNPDGDRRYILGGSWAEATYAFHYPNRMSPMDRSPFNGLRIVRDLGPRPDGLDPARELTRRLRDPKDPRRPPPDFVDLWRRMVAYDQAPLEERQERASPIVEGWSPATGEGAFRVERVSYNAAYGGERMAAVLFLPQEVEPPYQPLLHFPGDGVMSVDELAAAPWAFTLVDFFVRSGRALVYPIYKSAFERRDGVRGSGPEPGKEQAWQEHVVMWVQDVMRTIDYLETRDDMDLSSLGYHGFSWGGWIPIYLFPVEPRIQAAILLSGGTGSLDLQEWIPNTFLGSYPNYDVNLLAEVTIPVLMLNGKYDHVFPVEHSQKLFFEALATPEDSKRHVIYPEAGHGPLPRHKVIRESLDFLDRHLGPVDRRVESGS